MRICIFLLAFVTVCAHATASQQPQQADGQQFREQAQHADPAIQQPKENKRGTDEVPFVVKNYPQQDPADRADAEKDRREKADADAWTIRIGIATFIILIVQAIAFGIQARRLKETVVAMKKIADDQRTDVRASIDVSKESAEAAKATANTTEESLISNQRPWLVIEKISPRGKRHRGQGSITFDTVIRNVGNSLATSVLVESEEIKGKEGFPSIDEVMDVVQRRWRKNPIPGVTIAPRDTKCESTGFCIMDLEHPANAQYISFVVCCVYYSFPFVAKKNSGFYAAVYRVLDATPDDLAHVLVEFDERFSHAE